MKKKYLISILLCMMLGLFGCATEEEPQLTDSQLLCEHEWVEVDKFYDRGAGDIMYAIYCPKCKSEMNVVYKEFNKIQADMEYQNSK